MTAEPDYLYGRDDLLATALASTAPVLVLFGDSGVGKSSLLRAVQRASSDTLAPEPVELGLGPAALQRGVGLAVADSLSELTESDPDVDALSVRLKGAARRLASALSGRLKDAAAEHVLDLLRAKYGEAAAVTAQELRSAVRGSAEDSLRARITAAGDTDALAALLAVASDVAALAGEPVTLALDNVQNLSEDDRRRLAGAAGELPEGLRLRLSVTSVGRESADLLDLLRSGDRNWSL